MPYKGFLFDADYARDGQDLVLTDDHGREVVVDGYFTVQPAPDLVNSDGARVTGDFATLLAGPGQVAQAGPSGDAAAVSVGTIETLEGVATVRHADGSSETLSVGSKVYQNDIIETGSGASLGVLLKDGTVLGVGPGSRMAIDSFVYDQASTDGNLGLSFLKGAVSFVSGKIAKNDYDDVSIKVPYGSIGIRGTEFVVEIAADGTTTVFVLDGAVASIAGGQEIVLDPGEYVSLGAAGLSDAAQIAIAAIEARYGSLLTVQRNTIIIRDQREGEDDADLNVAPEAGGNATPSEGDAPGDGGDGTDPGPGERETQIQLDEYAPILNVGEIGDFSELGTVGLTSLRNSLSQFRIPDDDQYLLTLTTFIGTDGDDLIIGGDTNDFISGLGGNDTLIGLGGDDIVLGGSGNDFIYGSPGDDSVDGGTGNDVIEGGQGSADILLGGAGNDLIYGDVASQSGAVIGDHDTLRGQAGDDTLIGGGGNDILEGGTGNDLLDGGRGDDILLGGAGTDTARLTGSIEDYRFTVDGQTFTLRNLETGDRDQLESVENLLIGGEAYSLVSVSLNGDETVREGRAADYSLSLGGAELQNGQTLTVQLDLDLLGDVGTTPVQDIFRAALQSAADGTDGVTFDGVDTLTFSAGATGLDFNLAFDNDTVIEDAEIFRIRIGDMDGTSGTGMEVLPVTGSSSVTTGLFDRTNQPLTWGLEQSDTTVQEGETIRFDIDWGGITLSEGHTLSFDLAFSGEASGNEDFVQSFLGALEQAVLATTGVSLSGTTITFDSTAESSFSFALEGLSDGQVEGDESFSITLSSPRIDGNPVAGSEPVNLETVLEDADTLVFSLAGQDQVTEGEDILYTLSWAGEIPAGETALVTFSLTDITTSGGDRYSLKSTLLEAAGQVDGVTYDEASGGLIITGGNEALSSLSIVLKTKNDSLVELNESLSLSIETVTLSNGGSGGIVDGEVTTTIVDEDPLVLSFGGASQVQQEGNSAVFSVVLAGLALSALPAGGSISFDVDLSFGTADGTDIIGDLSQSLQGLPTGVTVTGTGNQLTITVDDRVDFTNGQLTLDFSLPLNDQDGPEADQDFTLSLGNVVSDLIPVQLGLDAHVVTIEDPTYGANLPTEGPDFILGGPGDDYISALGGNDTVYGDVGHDLILGDEGDDSLFGEGGHDTLRGGQGDDTLVGGAGNDRLIGGEGHDQMLGGDGEDTLIGGEDGGAPDYGENSLSGGAGDDLLQGADGADWLMGGAGLDTMTGGAGADSFWFDGVGDIASVAGNGVFSGAADVITDFETGQDKVHLDPYGFAFDGGYDPTDDFLTTIGMAAYDGTNVDYGDGQDTGEAKVIFDGTTLYYDENGSGEGYSVIARLDTGEITGADISTNSALA
nr:FecR domain-containing protein [Sneathiella chinensis]